MPNPTGPTDPILRRLVRHLRESGKKNKAKVWLDLAERLEAPRRSRAEVNLSSLSRYTVQGSVIVVPGKVLAAGRLKHAMSVVAFKFSRVARKKIVEAGGSAMTISQMLEQNPSGKGVILME